MILLIFSLLFKMSSALLLLMGEILEFELFKKRIFWLLLLSERILIFCGPYVAQYKLAHENGTSIGHKFCLK